MCPEFWVCLPKQGGCDQWRWLSLFFVVVIVKLWCLQDAEYENQSRYFWPIIIQNSSFYPIKIFWGVLYIELEIPISLGKLESGSIRGSFKLIYPTVDHGGSPLRPTYLFHLDFNILLGDFETWLFVKGEKDIRPKVELPKLKPITFIWFLYLFKSTTTTLEIHIAISMSIIKNKIVLFLKKKYIWKKQLTRIIII